MSIRSISVLFLFAASALFAAEPKPAARSGEEIYKEYCGSCHGGGWQAAPVAYDERDWSERTVKGLDVMFQNAKKGMNTMPPMGTCMDCTDAELTDAIKEMLRF